jgi:hypothetical protein
VEGVSSSRSTKMIWTRLWRLDGISKEGEAALPARTGYRGVAARAETEARDAHGGSEPSWNVSDRVAKAQATTGQSKSLEQFTTRTTTLTPYTTVSTTTDLEGRVAPKARREAVIGVLFAVAKMAMEGLPR